MQISIVVPAYNEEKIIRNCLKALANQKTSHNFEVILVDNNSSDKTVQIAKKFESKMKLKIIKEKKQGRGAARYRGFKESKSPYIFSTDADAILPPDWIETFMKEFTDPDIGAITSFANINDCDALTNLMFNRTQPLFMHLYRLTFGHYWLSGFSFVIRKSVYQQAGEFRHDLQGQEDTELSFRVSKVARIKYINKPVIFSGRRFKRGLIPGFFDYLKSYTETVLLKREKSQLSNIR